ncbi:MAG: tetraacyldisaccharide 4'-kinase, partial [Bacteroidota bacterium]
MSILRYFLFPFSLIYGLITEIRNNLFDSKILSSQEHSVKTIAIGNLSMGGTGKSPVTLYLTALLSGTFNLAILSRGYGRKTKGFKWVEFDSLASDAGDEPLMFKTIVGEKIPVAVCEDRNSGVENIRLTYPKTELILLDDAFQHRKIKPGFSILLTKFDNPFFNDFVVPAGKLRENRSGAKRADVILVTKCPNSLSITQKNEFQLQLKKFKKP